jgi:hypothetical protein
MPKRTQQARLVDALQRRGAELLKGSVGDRRVVLRFPGKEDNFYVGRAGAVRKGKTFDKSVPILDTAKAIMLREVPA